MMKMAGVCEIVLLLLWVTSGSTGCQIYATTGMNVTVQLDYKLTDHKLRWRHNNKIIVDRKGAKVTNEPPNDSYQNGSLKLTNVQKNQSGEYTPEVFAVDTGTSVKSFKSTKLCVLDPVPKPKVTQKCNKSDVEFFCAVGKNADGYTFKWLGDGKEIKVTTQKLNRQIIQLGSVSISCTVNNKASQVTSDPVKQECSKPGSFLPEKVLGISVWVFVAGGGGIVIVLILLTIVCCIRTKRKKSMRIKDEEELRLGWTNTQQQQHQHQHQHSHPPDHPHRHHHHHHQQQPAGHTGPRQQRTKQPRPRAPDPINGQPKPNPRRAQPPKPPNDDDDQPPPLPQPRKKGPKTPKM